MLLTYINVTFYYTDISTTFMNNVSVITVELRVIFFRFLLNLFSEKPILTVGVVYSRTLV